MKNAMMAAAAMAGAMLAITPAGADKLSTGTDDGQVELQTNGTGYMSQTGSYNPVGTQDAASTTYRSDIYYRIGTEGPRATFSSGDVQAFTGSDTERSSTFTLPGLSVALTQSVSKLFNNGVQTGSLLSQAYRITNLSASSISLDLVRYLDGDLNFVAGLNDGGGVLTSGGSPLLFETDDLGNKNSPTTFVGVYNRGGQDNGYQIGGYSTLAAAMAAGVALNGTVEGDSTNDQFVDSAYDLALGVGNLLTIDANGNGLFTTYTLFGSGSPDSVVETPASPAPEPATWAMMIVGFGAAGASLRRKRRAERTGAAIA